MGPGWFAGLAATAPWTAGTIAWAAWLPTISPGGAELTGAGPRGAMATGCWGAPRLRRLARDWVTAPPIGGSVTPAKGAPGSCRSKII